MPHVEFYIVINSKPRAIACATIICVEVSRPPVVSIKVEYVGMVLAYSCLALGAQIYSKLTLILWPIQLLIHNLVNKQMFEFFGLGEIESGSRPWNPKVGAGVDPDRGAT